ncbi:MAG: DUF3109 family protein [Bacteroidales bacterium]|nr:DUF3109 family protein [Bacteroidales bacterium]
MLRINDTIFSTDILEKKFSCCLEMCLGNCCRYGDSGAPLADDEVEILSEIWPSVKPYLRPEGIKTIEEKGTSVIDSDNDHVTPLIDNMECAYTFLKNNIFMCGIEKAWNDGTIKFRKPVSCHLFPARVKHFTGFTAVNYEELAICSAARENGDADSIYVYEFLKEPFIRMFGEKTYNELCLAADELKRRAG